VAYHLNKNKSVSHLVPDFDPMKHWPNYKAWMVLKECTRFAPVFCAMPGARIQLTIVSGERKVADNISPDEEALNKSGSNVRKRRKVSVEVVEV
jgi:hypothetical protein